MNIHVFAPVRASTGRLLSGRGIVMSFLPVVVNIPSGIS